MNIESGQFLDESRKLVKVSGTDAKKFLQGMITNDIEASISSLIYSALLTPQGKYLFDFFIAGLDEENFLIDIDLENHKKFLDKLKLYKLRSNVSFEEIDSSVILGFGERIKGSFNDPRNKKLGWRKIVFRNLINYDFEHKENFFKEYEKKRIDLCIPKCGCELKSGETYILETGFDKINGVSFTKGCFVGQEVTARMRHKTALKNGLVILQSSTQVLEFNGQITNENGKPVGSITSSLNNKGLGIIKFIYSKGKLFCGETELKVLHKG